MQVRNYQKELEKIIEQIQKEGRVPSLLLHSCCAPCSSYVLSYLSEYFRITVLYYNPNIEPEEEYLRRLDTQRQLLSLLPEDMQPAFTPYLKQEKGYDHDVVKAADKISAYIKCLEEKRAGNREFDYAAENVKAAIDAIELPEVKDFLRDFLPAFEMTLDELNHPI